MALVLVVDDFSGDFGAAELLPKPFKMPDLLAAVNRLLR